MRLAGPVLCLLVAAAMPVAVQQQAVFRTVADAVTVSVSVRDDKRPVQNLTASDFVVRDDGVLQEITAARTELPLDVSLLLDVSGTGGSYPTGIRVAHRSVPPRAWAAASAETVARSLREGDRLQLISVASDIQVQPLPLDLSGLDDPARARNRLARTAWLDAVGAALMLPVEPDRRRLIVVASQDGIDTASAMPRELLAAIVDRSEAIVHLIALGGRLTPREAIGAPSTRFDGYDELVDALTNRSGGRFHRVLPGMDFRDALRDAIEELRTSYVLTYVPTGVASDGWHEIDVSVTDRDYEVRARAGYWRGGGER